MNKEERNTFRKEIIGKLEEQWAKNNRPEDDLFYYHPSEDKIVLSHALFWVMTQNIKGKVGKEKYLLLLRQYQEEMLEAWLTESSDFKDLSLLSHTHPTSPYETIPTIHNQEYSTCACRDSRQLAASRGPADKGSPLALLHRRRTVLKRRVSHSARRIRIYLGGHMERPVAFRRVLVLQLQDGRTKPRTPTPQPHPRHED